MAPNRLFCVRSPSPASFIARIKWTIKFLRSKSCTKSQPGLSDVCSSDLRLSARCVLCARLSFTSSRYSRTAASSETLPFAPLSSTTVRPFARASSVWSFLVSASWASRGEWESGLRCRFPASYHSSTKVPGAWTGCPLCSTFSVTKPVALTMGLRTNHCPPIFTRLLSHATRFAILGSPVPLRPLILGKRVDYVSVGQTVAKYFVNPVDCEAGGEGGILLPQSPASADEHYTSAIIP